MPYKPAVHGFYRPHKRVSEDGAIIDPRTGELTYPPTMTKQAHRDECDINNILKQYRLTGIVRHISAKAAQGAYQDLPDPMEFQDALHMVMRAEESFETLPSSVRARFGNDPTAFLEFTSNPANAAELVELGLATRSPDQEPPPPGPGAAPAPSTPPAPETP